MRKLRQRVSRRELIAGAAGVAATALSPRGEARVSGSRPTRRPNILFLISDQHRADWLGRNPDVPVPTPNMDRLAARGVDFTRAVVPSPVCGPSRSCLASGMEYENCGVEKNRQVYPAAKTTFYEHLRNSGYHTMACGKIDLHKGPAGRSLDGQLHREEWGLSEMQITGSKEGGFLSQPVGPKEPYYAYLESLDPPLGRTSAEDIMRRATPKNENWWGMTEPCPLDDDHYLDNFTARYGLELLDRAPEGKPWFLFVNFNGPHPPMDITASMERHYRGPDRVIEGFAQPHSAERVRNRHFGGNRGQFAPAHHIRIRQNYSAMVENIDRWLGIYQDRLRQRGELEETIVIYSSDHGEMLGDHAWWGKSIPYRASVAVPLIVAGPGVAEGVRTEALVSLMDVAATCIEYADLPIPDELESLSLRPLLESGRGEHRDYLRSALVTEKSATGRWRMVEDHRYKLVEGFFEERALFDLEADPRETENVAASRPDVVARLEKLFVDR